MGHKSVLVCENGNDTYFTMFYYVRNDKMLAYTSFNFAILCYINFLAPFSCTF